MKGKPDLSVLDKVEKDPTAFLEGAVTEQKRPAYVPPAPQEYQRVPREQKIFRLPMDLIQALKTEAYQRSLKSGTRVTETELVEEALRGFLKV